jgi:hypothetical protein
MFVPNTLNGAVAFAPRIESLWKEEFSLVYGWQRDLVEFSVR